MVGQAGVLDAIQRRYTRTGRGTTLRAICADTGLRSYGDVSELVHRLRECGYVGTHQPGARNAIVPVILGRATVDGREWPVYPPYRAVR